LRTPLHPKTLSRTTDMSAIQTYKKAMLFSVAAFAFASTASAQVIRCDSFSYPDGSLVPQGTWANHSGTAGDFQILSGQAVVQHGTPSEDVNIAFTPVAGKVFFGIDFSVDDLGGPWLGTDTEYFAHFKDSGFAFRARFDVVQALNGGDFSVGIASDDSTADAIWATDLSFGVTYRAIASYDQVTNQAELWINPTTSASTSILGDLDGNPGNSMSAFALRQSDSDMNETLRIDNLVVGQSFGDVLTIPGTCGTQTPRFATVPNLAVLTAGNAPMIGSTYDPMVTGTGTADFLFVSFFAGIELPLSFGTLLCDISSPTMTFINAPGTAYSLPIPMDPTLIGLPLCLQGASVGASIELTNALDIVIGG